MARKAYKLRLLKKCYSRDEKLEIYAWIDIDYYKQPKEHTRIKFNDYTKRITVDEVIKKVGIKDGMHYCMLEAFPVPSSSSFKIFSRHYRKLGWKIKQL